MRTTVTINDNLAHGLKKLQKKQPQKSFKEILNQVIEQGLAVSESMPKKKFEIKPLNAAHNPNYNFDCISRLIAEVEGDMHK